MASRIRISVTSLGRTWPSTIFWRAVTKPDIGGPGKRYRTKPRESSRNRVISGTNFAKTQRRLRRESWHSAIPFECFRIASPMLFDRHHEPPDQPGDLVQLGGIVFRDDSREPDQAFLIGQRGNVAGDDRGSRPQAIGRQQIGLHIRHRITSAVSRHPGASAENKSFSGSAGGPPGPPGCPGMAEQWFCRGRKGQQIVAAEAVTPPS